jgi:hypothetical protein
MSLVVVSVERLFLRRGGTLADRPAPRRLAADRRVPDCYEVWIEAVLTGQRQAHGLEDLAGTRIRLRSDDVDRF